ncbi:MAG: hypothetical protein R2864_00090 [Syntrophotaleaceae bacterium]
MLFSPETRRIHWAPGRGYSGVDKRIGIIATAIKANMTVDDLTEIDTLMRRPIPRPRPVNMAGE